MAARVVSSKAVTRHVTVNGLSDILFDRYPGNNSTDLSPDQKFYFGPDGKTIVMPAINVMSFLSAENTMSAPKRLLDSREYKKIAQACRSFVRVQPNLIPFLRDGQPIRFEGFVGGRDASSGAYILEAVARLEKGIPNPKVRPALPLPWSLEFDVTLYPNNEIKEELLQSLFVRGGLALGFGTWRGMYGLFEVARW